MRSASAAAQLRFGRADGPRGHGTRLRLPFDTASTAVAWWARRGVIRRSRRCDAIAAAAGSFGRPLGVHPALALGISLGGSDHHRGVLRLRPGAPRGWPPREVPFGPLCCCPRARACACELPKQRPRSRSRQNEEKRGLASAPYALSLWAGGSACKAWGCLRPASLLLLWGSAHWLGLPSACLSRRLARLWR